MAELLEKEVALVSGAVTLTTTSETVVVTSPQVTVPRNTVRVIVRAWAVLQTGAGTTSVSPRVRRGSTTSGTQIGGGNAEQVKTAAGNVEPFRYTAIEERSNVESVQYSLTLQQVGATGNGSILDAAIEVEVLNG